MSKLFASLSSGSMTLKNATSGRITSLSPDGVNVPLVASTALASLNTSAGEMIFNTTTQALQIYNGTGFISLAQTGALTLQSSLTDVALTGLTAGQALTYNGVKWTNATPASTLAGLTDVQLASVTSGQALTYNGTKWTNTTIAAALSALTDVSLSSLVTGQALTYNGTKWTNTTIATALSGLTDVSLSSLTKGNYLKYNGTSWTNTTPTAGDVGLTGLSVASQSVNTSSQVARTSTQSGSQSGTFTTNSSNGYHTTITIFTFTVPADYTSAGVTGLTCVVTANNNNTGGTCNYDFYFGANGTAHQAFQGNSSSGSTNQTLTYTAAALQTAAFTAGQQLAVQLEISSPGWYMTNPAVTATLTYNATVSNTVNTTGGITTASTGSQFPLAAASSGFNQFQIGSAADFNGLLYGVGIAAPANSTLAPLGVMVGGGTSALTALKVSALGAVSTLFNTVDDTLGNVVLGANNGNAGILPYQANTGNGGVLFDSSWGNLKFKGGTSASQWNVYDQNNNPSFSILNATSGASAGTKVFTPHITLEDGFGRMNIPYVTAGPSGLLIGSNTSMAAGSYYALGIAMPNTTGAWPLGIEAAGVKLFNVQNTGVVATKNSTLEDSAGNATFGGTQIVVGSTTAGIQMATGSWSNFANSGCSSIYNDTNGYKALMLVGNSSAGGLRIVKMYDNVQVSGALSASIMQSGVGILGPHVPMNTVTQVITAPWSAGSSNCAPLYEPSASYEGTRFACACNGTGSTTYAYPSFASAGFAPQSNPDGASWTKARLIVRGVSTGTDVYGVTVTLTVLEGHYSTNPQWNSVASWGAPDQGGSRGPVTQISPWFTMQGGDVTCYALGASQGYVFGTVYMQFSS